jgi:hypothetical protein
MQKHLEPPQQQLLWQQEWLSCTGLHRCSCLLGQREPFTGGCCHARQQQSSLQQKVGGSGPMQRKFECDATLALMQHSCTGHCQVSADAHHC